MTVRLMAVIFTYSTSSRCNSSFGANADRVENDQIRNMRILNVLEVLPKQR